MSGVLGVLASQELAPVKLTFVTSVTGSSSLYIPGSGVQVGDIAILCTSAHGLSIAKVWDSTFTEVREDHDVDDSRMVSGYKIIDAVDLDGAEDDGRIITGMNDSEEHIMLLVFRPSKPITSENISVVNVNGEATVTNPVAQTLSLDSYTDTRIGVAFMSATNTVSPRTISPSGSMTEVAGDTSRFYGHYVVYNKGQTGTQSTISVDMDDEGDNVMQSWILTVSTPALPKYKTITWTQGDIVNQRYQGAAYAPLSNAKYFAFGGSSTGGSTTRVQYSTDGTTWTQGTLPVSGEYGAAVGNDSRVIAFTTDTVTAPFCVYSTNGTTWTSVSIDSGGVSMTFRQSLWDGTRFLVNSTLYMFYSTDGTSWSSVPLAYGGIGYDGQGKYVTTGAETSATGGVCTSDPTVSGNWSSITLPSSLAWRDVVYGNGIWVAAAAGSSTYATSNDGTTWTSRTLPSLYSESAVYTNYTKMIFIEGRFWYYYTDNLYVSEDGINWTTAQTFASSTLDNLSGWAADFNGIFGFGFDSAGAGSGKFLKGV